MKIICQGILCYFMLESLGREMRRRKLMFLCFGIAITLEVLCGSRYNSTHDLNRESKTGNTVKNEMTTSSTSNDAEETNVRRLQTVEKACRALGYTEANYTTEIRAHMSQNTKLLYCRVNKCASTLILEVLRKIFSCNTDCLIKSASMVKSSVNANKIMKGAFSFMAVREPYGRLFSTYCNIFYFPKEDWLYRGTKIIKLARSNISYDSLNFGHDLTFAELIKYTVESYEQGSHVDEHVRPMHHKSCNPCIFKFDYIAHLETLTMDFDFILKKMYRENVIENYTIDLVTSLRDWTLFGPVKHLFKTILLVKTSTISIYNIFLRAWTYYQIIGQISINIDLPYSEGDVSSITKDDFLRSLRIAIESSKNEGKSLNKQRHEALIQAYSTVSTNYMERLRKVVAHDCLFFGYEERPDFLFNRSRLLLHKDYNTFNFFKGL